LRPIVSADAVQLFSILADSSLYTFTGEKPPVSRVALRELYRFREARRSPDGNQLWLNWSITIRAAGEVIGYVQATVTAHCAEVAWVVGTHWQGQGYATEASIAVVSHLRAIGAKNIRANIHPNHTASHRVAQKSGFHVTMELVDDEEVWILGEAE
jgi:RimJ/RimL family protein N-acetyltransferase